MTYFSGNNISSSSFLEFRGPLGPNQPYPDDATAASGPIAALIGWGYGKRGYGQINQFLPAVDPGNNVSHIEWNALRASMSNINIHTGSRLIMQPQVDINGEIIAEDGVNSTANIEFLATTLDANRMLFDPDQMNTSTAIVSDRAEPWTGSITHEFTVDFGSEDRARWYFNSGGAINVSASRDYGTVTNVTVISTPFVSPDLYPVTWPAWSEFMNSYAVWINKVVVTNPVCIAVINETSKPASTIQASYNDLRTRYPYYKIYLLQPGSSYSPSALKIPSNWGSTGLDYGPINVPEDNGNPANKSDWYSICNLDQLPAGTMIGIFLDDSGSLGTQKVKASYDYLLQRIAARNISQVTAINTAENWLSPFITMNLTSAPGTPDNAGKLQTYYRTFNAPINGRYLISIQGDNIVSLYLDGVKVAQSSSFNGSPDEYYVSMSAGNHVLRFEAMNNAADSRGDRSWGTNPAGWAVTIRPIYWSSRTSLAAENVNTPTPVLSPQVYALQPVNTWSNWLNKNSVWVNPGTAILKNQTQTIYRNFTAPYSGSYRVEIATDDRIKFYIDGNQVANVYRNFGDQQPFVTNVNLSAGPHVLKFEALNDGVGDTWAVNPAGWGVAITGDLVWDTKSHRAGETLFNTTFYSPVVYPVTSSAGDWNSFMNNNAVWVNPVAESAVGVTQTRHRMFEVLQEGMHTFTYAVDDTMNIFINDALMISCDVATSRKGNNPGTKSIYFKEGVYVLRVDAYNSPIRGGWAINIKNPSGGLVWATRDKLASELIPGPQGPNVTIITDGTTNELVSNLLINSGTVIIGSETIDSTGTIGNTSVGGYYGLTGEYQTIFAAYDTGAAPVSTLTKVATYPTSATPYTYKVPDNVNLLRFKLWGAAGAGGGQFNTSTAYHGGAGAFVQATIPVIAGETLTIKVGGGGLKGITNGSWEDTYGGGGGGYTGIFRGTVPLLIAAGGGGSPAGGPSTANTILWSTRSALPAETVTIPGQPPINSPRVYSVTWTTWSSFMNNNAVWIQASSSNPAPNTVTVYRNFNAPTAGTYTFNIAADNEVSVYIDEVFVGVSKSYTGNPVVESISLGSGAHVLKFVVTNRDNPSPAGWAVTISSPRTAGRGGAGGIEQGSPGTTGDGTISSTGGTQSAGGTGGPGYTAAWNGANGKYLEGGYGGNHDVSGGKWVIKESYATATIIPGVNGGLNGGAMGGEQGAGGGGGGYFGGGGGGGANQAETGTPYSSGGGAGGSSYIPPTAGNVVVAVSSDWHTAPNRTDPDYISGVAQGGAPGTTKGDMGTNGGPGLAVLYTAGTSVPPRSINWVVQAKREQYQGVRAGNGSRIRITSTITSNGLVSSNAPVAHPVCIAVINETSQTAAAIQASYDQFRSRFPDHYLYLLQPQGSYGPAALKIPVGWSSARGDFGVITVTEDNGNPSNKSDWYTICNLDKLPAGSKIGIFVDDSGSLGRNKVSASYDYLLQRIAARSITQITAINTDENWISPFLNMNLTVPVSSPKSNTVVDGVTSSTIDRRIAEGVLVIEEPVFKTIRGFDQGGIVPTGPTGPAPVTKTTCIAVIDEVSPTAAQIQTTYNEFRQKWPNRNLYLLWPKNTDRSAVEILKIPQGWSPALGDYGPMIVNRDGGNVLKRSDWFTMIGMDALPENAEVALFVDKSGSMTLSTVRASYDLFVQKCQAKKLRLVTTFNGGENWIAPFIPKLFV